LLLQITMAQSKTKFDYVGTFLFWYNILIIALAIAALFSLKQFPQYKLAIILVVIGVVIVVIHSWIKYSFWKAFIIRQLVAFQTVHLNTCPEYWTTQSVGGHTTCVNEFNIPAEDDKVARYTFGSKSRTPIALDAVNEQTGDLCSNIKYSYGDHTGRDIPWIERSNKCTAAKHTSNDSITNESYDLTKKLKSMFA
jgi:hypothetical protein